MDAALELEVRDLTLAYGDLVVLRGVSFDVRRGDVFAVMGGSGSGKSTLLRALIGLLPPVEGEIRARAEDRSGVLFQFGALWSNLTLAENVALPLEELTALSRRDIQALVELKLALVGLRGFEAFYPGELSGGMQKRAGLARAIALDPEVLYLDEPSSGLDPVGAHRIDELILSLRDSLGATIVVVTHDLASIFRIATDSIFIDADARTITARGAPAALRADPPDARVRAFLTRGEEP